MAEGLFGPTPEEIQSAVRAQGQKLAFDYAQLPAGRVGVAAMANAGQNFGQAAQAALGYQDPAVKRAMLMEDARKEVDGAGLDLVNNPEEYTAAVAQALMKRGLHDEALRAVTMGQELILKKAQAKKAAERETQDTVEVLGDKLYHVKRYKDNGDLVGILGQAAGNYNISQDGPTDVLLNSDTGSRTALGPHYYAPAASVTVNNFGEKAAVATNEHYLKNVIGPLQERATKARARLSAIKAAQEAIKTGSFETGFLAGGRMRLAQAATLMGIDQNSEALKVLKMGNAATAEQIDAATKTVVAQLVDSLVDSGRGGAAQINLLKDSYAGLGKTPEGNLKILELAEKQATQDMQASFIADSYVAKNMGAVNPEDHSTVQQAVDEYYSANPLLSDKDERDLANLNKIANPKPWPGADKAQDGEIYRNAKDQVGRWDATTKTMKPVK